LIFFTLRGPQRKILRHVKEHILSLKRDFVFLPNHLSQALRLVTSNSGEFFLNELLVISKKYCLSCEDQSDGSL